MLVGYMRVLSEGDRQTTAFQQDALLAAGVDERHLFQDKASGARDDRPGLAAALDCSYQIYSFAIARLSLPDRTWSIRSCLSL
jgi:hypothetical protein